MFPWRDVGGTGDTLRAPGSGDAAVRALRRPFPAVPPSLPRPLLLGLQSHPPGPPDTQALGRGRRAALGPELRGLLWRLYPHCMAEWVLLLETFTFLWHCHKCRYEGMSPVGPCDV